MINLSKFLNKKKEDREYFLSLIINSRSVGAILFEKLGGSLHVISTKDEPIKDSAFDDEELLAASDKVISFVETSLPEGANLNKTIFAVPYDWIESGRIKREYLAKLKKICEGLDLTPIGFVISIEAITSFIKNKEGAPVSSLFVELGGGKVYVYVVKNDEIVEARKGEVEENVPKSVEKVLKKVENVEVLPSKIVLLDYEQAEEIQQEFISYQWSKELPFLHIPQTIVLEKGFEKEAIITGVGNQMGFAVEMNIKAGKDEGDEFVEKLKEEDPQVFGFVKDQDVQFAKKEEEVIDKAMNQASVEESNLITPGFEQRKSEEEKEEIKINDSSHPNSSPLALVVSSFKKIPIPKIAGLNFLAGQRKMGIFVIPIIFIVLLVLFSFVYYGSILKAEVFVFTEKKAVNEKVALTFSTDSPSSGKTVHVEALNEEVSGEGDADVTGITETGDKAKGEVSVYNDTEQKRTIAKGTTITSSNNLDFTLLEDVNIASKSAFAPTAPSSKAKVEASKFGTEFNLPSGSNFTVEGLASSVVFAKNDSALTGGTKKEIKSVSQKDLDNLESKIFNDLEKEAKDKAAKNKKEGEEILPESLDYEYVTKSFSKKKGDQASTLHLNSKIKFTLGSYKVADLEEIIRSQSESGIPESYKYVSDDSKVKLSDFKTEKNGNVSATLTADAAFVPDIKTQELSKEIKGKSVKSAEENLKKTDGISSYRIVLKNKLPLFPSKLPTNEKNINLIIRAE